MKRQWKRTLSFTLSLTMLFSMMGMKMVFTEEADGMTECHPTHGEDCGYVEDTEDIPCTHICDVCQPKESNTIMPEQNECTCIVKCAATDEENNAETSINADCPICRVSDMGLEMCKGKTAATFASKTASRAVDKRTNPLNLIEYITDNDGNPLTVSNGVYDMLAAEGWKWNSNTNTLTLSGTDIDVTSGNAIMLPTDATIEFLGENSVKSSDWPTIDGKDGLTFSGTGSIHISGKNAGIFSDQIAITGGTINVTADSDSAILARDTLKISGSANVSASGYYCGLQANGSGISISGATVKAASLNDVAIYTKGTLAISDSADVTATDSFYAGINAVGGITITDSTVNSGSGKNYTAIYTPQSVVIGGASHVTADGDWIGICADTSISIDDNAEVTVTGKSTGLQAVDTQISGNAKVTATSVNASAISGKDNLSITGNVEVTATGAQAGIVSNGSMTLSAKDIQATGGWYGVDNEGSAASGITIGGKLTAEATVSGHGIYSVKSITADGNTDITATGAYSGVSTDGDITFTGSKIEAIGKRGCGITSKGKITIRGGSIHAKSSFGYTAIRTENIKIADEAAVSKISLTNVIEQNGAKTAFCDWVSNDGETISWTTFIGKDDDELAMVDGGLFTNGLLEVWLAESAHDWETAWTSDSSDHWHKCKNAGCTQVNSKAAHTPGDWVIDQAATDTVAGSKHRDCSVCGYKETAAIPVFPHTHTPKTEWEKDANNHWHDCIANDNERMNQAAHTWNTGEVTTPATHTQDGIKTYTCTVCGQTKTEVIPKLPPNTVIGDDSTGIKVEYEDGTPFDDDVVLKIIAKPQAKMNKFKDAVDKVAPGLTLSGLYEIYLLKDGVAVQPDGKIKMSIPLTDKMKSMTDLKIIYIDDDGNVTIIPSEVKDGKLVFVTDHFSYYGVVGKAKATAPGDNNGEECSGIATDDKAKAAPEDNNDPNGNSPQTGDNSPMLLFVLMMGVSGTALVILGKKRKVWMCLKK